MTSGALPWLARYVEGDQTALFEPRFQDGLTLFRHAVEQSGAAPAIHYFDRTLSYAEVDRLSDRFAAWLAHQGVAAGDRVALYLQNVPQFLICLVGAWKAGAIGVSINPMNRARELTLLLQDSGARVLEAHRDLYEQFAREVLALLNLGMSNKVIARKLVLSDNTVRRHMQEILKYFKVATRAEAVLAARQQALVG